MRGWPAGALTTPVDVTTTKNACRRDIEFPAAD
jgi:hypothetical protein